MFGFCRQDRNVFDLRPSLVYLLAATGRQLHAVTIRLRLVPCAYFMSTTPVVSRDWTTSWDLSTRWILCPQVPSGQYLGEWSSRTHLDGLDTKWAPGKLVSHLAPALALTPRFLYCFEFLGFPFLSLLSLVACPPDISTSILRLLGQHLARISLDRQGFGREKAARLALGHI